MSREEVLRLHCPVSAEARSSMSPTRQDMREHSRSMLAMNFSLWSGAVRAAHMLERMTARGARSSWDAAAINSFCCFWLSANGFKDFPTNTQLTDISAVIPARLRRRNRKPCRDRPNPMGSLRASSVRL